jgi:hypothetical protein
MLLAMLCVVPAVSAAAPTSHEGMVISAAAGKLVMTDKDGKEHSHAVPSTAKIMVDGKLAKLEDLKKGRMIKVTMDESKVLEVATVDVVKFTQTRWLR